MKKVLGTLALALFAAASSLAAVGSNVLPAKGAECCLQSDGGMICSPDCEPDPSCCPQAR
jgi:hypothetical protein